MINSLDIGIKFKWRATVALKKALSFVFSPHPQLNFPRDHIKFITGCLIWQA